MSDLTVVEYDMLLEAVEAWKHKDSGAELASMMMEGMLSRGLPDCEMHKLEQKREDRQRKAEREQKQRTERAIVISAKLIAMRDHEKVEQVCNRV